MSDRFTTGPDNIEFAETGERLTVLRKLADQEAATFVKAKIVSFFGGRGAGSP